MNIGPVQLPERPLLLAPMEDVSDPPFRILCKRYGADMLYTEFISSGGLSYGAEGSVRKLDFYEQERPLGIQIFGGEIDQVREATKIVDAAGPDLIDINFGCPVKKVVCKDGGAGILRNLDKMQAITAAVIEEATRPVTVKTRLGWDDNSIRIVDVARMLGETGIAALAVHARTRSQMYKGEARWEWLRKIKEEGVRDIPFFGNGDAYDPHRIKAMFDETGVDGVMIGRGAIGNPWIFRDARAFLDTGEVPRSAELGRARGGRRRAPPAQVRVAGRADRRARDAADVRRLLQGHAECEPPADAADGAERDGRRARRAPQLPRGRARGPGCRTGGGQARAVAEESEARRSRSMTSRFMLALALGFACSCESEDEAPVPEPGAEAMPESPGALADHAEVVRVELRTDSTRYTALPIGKMDFPRYRFRVVARFENSEPDSVYLATSRFDIPGYSVGVVESQETGSAAYDPWWAGSKPPLVVAPGGLRTDTLYLAGPNSSSESQSVLTGQFQLGYRVHFCRTLDAACVRGYETVGSNPFAVRLSE